MFCYTELGEANPKLRSMGITIPFPPPENHHQRARAVSLEIGSRLAERLPVSDILGLSVLSFLERDALKLIPPGPVDLRDLRSLEQYSMQLVLGQALALSTEAGFLPSHPVENANVALNFAWASYKRWYKEELLPALLRADGRDSMDKPSERDLLLNETWSEIIDNGEMPVNGSQVGKELSGFLELAFLPASPSSKSPKKRSQTEDTNTSKPDRDAATSFVLDQVLAHEVLFRGEDGRLCVGNRQIRDLLKKRHTRTPALRERVVRLDSPRWHSTDCEKSGLQVEDEREPGPEHVAYLRDARELRDELDRTRRHPVAREVLNKALAVGRWQVVDRALDWVLQFLNMVEGITEPTLEGAIAYELSRDKNSGAHGAWSRTELGRLYGSEPHQIEYQAKRAAQIIRERSA